MKVRIVGAGINGLEQITLEGLEQITSSQKILSFCNFSKEFAEQYNIDLSRVEYIHDPTPFG